MDDLEVFLNNKTLKGMGREAHKLELACSLKAMQTQDGKNRAVFKRDGTTPVCDLEILPSPAVGKPGASKLFEGTLTVGQSVIPVTVFRLASSGG